MFSFKKLMDAKGSALVMGILNITPDSFSDGGEAFCVDSVVEKVKMLCEQGADIIDVGACSTAPGNCVVSSDEELKRLKRFLPYVVSNSTVPVSVDTFRCETARYALSEGVSIVNDESGAFSSEMAAVVKGFGAGWIFMHTGGGTSETTESYNSDVVGSVLSFFYSMKEKAESFDINKEQLCYDCGIGFGKTREDDIMLLSSCKTLSQFSPLLIGASRKRVIGEIIGIKEPVQRDNASAVASALAVLNGASVVRVHNVPCTVEALKVCNSMKNGEL